MAARADSIAAIDAPPKDAAKMAPIFTVLRRVRWVLKTEILRLVHNNAPLQGGRRSRLGEAATALERGVGPENLPALLHLGMH